MVSKKKFLGIVLTTSVLVVILVTVIVVVVLEDEPDEPETVKVKTVNAGTLIGKITTLKDGKTKMNEFHNVRYAKAPVGTQRFKPPVKNEITAGTEISATDDSPVMCIQSDTGLGTEDCLVLSLRTSSLDESSKKPVIVWIHGGGLVTGYGQVPGYSFDSEVTHELDAVTVNINYRLGFLGFSAVKELWEENEDGDPDSENANANNGIRDMIAALDWIQENIKKFGGDPKSVTIIGESGGGTAVLALVSSPLANNKFHAAISQSPAPEMRFDLEKGDEFQRYVLERLGCAEDGATNTNIAERRQCLYDKPAKDMTFDYKNPINLRGSAYFMFPKSMGEIGEYVGQVVIDGTVLETAPKNLGLASFKPSSPLPIIISNCAEEIWQQSWMTKPPVLSKGDLTELLETHLKTLDGNLADDDDVATQAATLTKLYSPAINPFVEPLKVWSYLVCEMRSTCPSNDVAESMNKDDQDRVLTDTNRQIYRLYVSHKPSIPGIPAFHAYDSLVLFNYTSPSLNATMGLNEQDFKFHTHYVEMVKKLAQNKTPGDDWGTFPEKSMIYENSEDISKVIDNKPQQQACSKLDDLDLVKYGWQN